MRGEEEEEEEEGGVVTVSLPDALAQLFGGDAGDVVEMKVFTVGGEATGGADSLARLLASAGKAGADEGAADEDDDEAEL